MIPPGALVLLGLVVAQGGLGYLQYALGVPPVPVIFHVLGAALVWAAVLLTLGDVTSIALQWMASLVGS